MQDDLCYRILKISKAHVEKPNGYHTTTCKIHTFEEIGYCNDYKTMEEAIDVLMNHPHEDGEYTIIPVFTVKNKKKYKNI